MRRKGTGMFQSVDGYCERLGPGLWAEPLNALSNLAFLIAAVIMARRARGLAMPTLLVGELALIGIGSGLFHTVAQGWAALADVIPILLFILTCLYAANRQFWGLARLPAAGLTALFLPYAAATGPLFSLIPGLGSSAGYAPVPLLILIYAALLWTRQPAPARGLALGGGLLTVSLIARSLDLPLCATNPSGTHFLWHLLNAGVLALMMETLIRNQKAHP